MPSTDQPARAPHRHRRRRVVAGVVSAAAFVAASGVVAFATDGTLPGGTPISVDITSPLDGAVIPYGTPVTFEGTASVGTNNAQPTVRLVYDLDVSGSTSTSGGVCGDVNTDGRTNTVLDCEVQALVNLNQQAIAKGSIQDVGAVALGGHTNGQVGGAGDSIEGDVDPSGGLQLLTTPAADVDTNGTKDVEQVLKSARNGNPGVGGFGSQAGFGSFGPRIVTAPNTNFEQSVIVASNLANTASPSAASKVVVLVSDGQANSGSQGLVGANALGQFPTAAAFTTWVQSVAGSVRFITFAVGSTATCLDTPEYGSLQLIAQATGGSCTLVPDPATLPNLLPALVVSQLTSVTATDNGAPVPLTVTPTPPQDGPASFTWSAAAGPLSLSPGTHELCANAFGADSGGTGSVQECATVHVVAVDPGGPYGGVPGSSYEGTDVSINATLNGSAVFDHWGYAPGAGVDAGATCTFADPSAASTTVNCTDDGTYTLTAYSTGPVDQNDADLVLYNADPVITSVTSSPSGTVLTGSSVTVTASFTDAGTNDSHTCIVDWGGSIGAVLRAVSESAGSGTCTDTQTLTAAGSYPITVTIADDDGGGDTEASSTGAVSVEDLDITPGGGPNGSYTGDEGSPVTPTVTAPAGTTFVWSVSPDSADAGTQCDVADDTTDHPSVTCDDDGLFTMSVDATLNGQTVHAEIPLVLGNVAPVITDVSASPSAAVFVGTPVTITASFTDAGANDSHTCSVDWPGIGPVPGSVSESAGSGTCTSTQTPGVPGGTVTVTVTDDDGGSDTGTVDVAVTSVQINPGGGADGSYTGDEGDGIEPTAVTPDGATLLWAATPVTADPGASCTVSDETTAAPTVTCNDDGTFEISLTVTVGGVSQTATVPLVLANVAPTVDEPVVSPSVVAVGAPVSASSTLADAGTNDTHTCAWTWGDATSSAGVVTEAAGSGTCSGSHAYTAPGIYLLRVDVTDDDGGTGSAEYRYVVVYDPSAGFVTGGGTIDVAAGSYVPDPALAGKGTFGFVSKYKKGATVPDGNTQFQFHAAGLNFSSTTYQWLVVSGAKAQYKGSGTINGVAGYGFLVTVTDGNLNGGGGVDQFRIKIWDQSTGAVVFDNVLGGADGDLSAPAQAISSGSIVIHSGK